VPPPRPLPYAAHLSLSSHVLTHTHTRARPHPHPSQLALAAALALVGSAAAAKNTTSSKFTGKLAALEMLSNKTDEVKDEAWEMAAWKLNKTVHMVSVGRGETRGEARDRGWRSSRPLLPPPRKKTHPAPLLSSPLTAPPHPHPTRTHRPTRCSSTRTRPTRRSSESMQKRREGIVALWRRGSHHPNLNTLTPPLLHPIHTIRSLSKFEDHVDAKFDMLIEGLNETYQKIEGAKEEVEVRGKVQNGKTDVGMDGETKRNTRAHSLFPSLSLSLYLSLSLLAGQGRRARQDGRRQDRHAAHGARGEADDAQGAVRTKFQERVRGWRARGRDTEASFLLFFFLTLLFTFPPLLQSQNTTFGVKEKVEEKIEGIMTGFNKDE